MALVTPQKTNGTAPAAAAPPKLKLITSRGKKDVPLFVALYSPEGFGKTTWASQAPNPLFFDIEHGTSQLDVQRFVFDESGRTTPASLGEVMLGLRAVEVEEHDFKTVVIDTADALEALIHAQVVADANEAKIKGIEDFGYGKGYVAALDRWRVVVAQLERLRARGLNVIVLAHSHIKTFKDPASEGWDRYQLKLHQSAAGLIKEKAEIVLFGNFEEFAAKDERTKRIRGVSEGARVLHTVHSPAWDAKNRHGLPDVMPLDWDTFYAACKAHQPAPPDEINAAIVALLPTLSEKDRVTAQGMLKRANGDAEKLAQLLGWARQKSTTNTASAEKEGA